MNKKDFVLLFFILINSIAATYGQSLFSIKGVVVDSEGHKLSAATVFLDGSQKKTITDAEGSFSFSGVSSGTYDLIAHFIGYYSISKTIIVQDASSSLVKVIMKQKSIALKEVVIGDDKARRKHMEIFKKNFLGQSKNSKECKILNPEIIDFTTKSKILEATTDDFLIIENSSLGYRIKYLLRNFRFNRTSSIASYDGECIFEEMKGSEDQLSQWKLNRKIAYEGSFMHYLRSLFKNRSREEGFLTYLIEKPGQLSLIAPIPITDNQITKRIDSTFMVMKFPKRIYTIFDKEKASSSGNDITAENVVKSLSDGGSIVKLFVDEAVVDIKGSYVDYKSFLLQGYWGSKRISDRLPFEYEP